MNSLAIGMNVKKLRGERDVTQQQLADAVGVSYQAVSKWENGTTMPDVGLLPEIASFFDVTIDELFKPDMKAYRNKAARLMAVYETDFGDSDAFDKADAEYQRMMAVGEADIEDLGSYAYLNECRARYYLQLAERYYLEADEKGTGLKNAAYYKNQRQYILFLARLGRHRESIERHTVLLCGDPDNPMHYSALAEAYKCAGDMEKAYNIAEKGLSWFPDDALLLVFAGDICKRLGKIDKAITYWNRAYAIDPEMIDTRYSLAMYLTETEQYRKAEEVWLHIIGWHEQRGYMIETKFAKTELMKVRKAMLENNARA
jgi:transcriptional regulator with XRE-family HTH domain